MAKVKATLKDASLFKVAKRYGYDGEENRESVKAWMSKNADALAKVSKSAKSALSRSTPSKSYNDGGLVDNNNGAVNYESDSTPPPPAETTYPAAPTTTTPTVESTTTATPTTPPPVPTTTTTATPQPAPTPTPPPLPIGEGAESLGQFEPVAAPTPPTSFRPAALEEFKINVPSTFSYSPAAAKAQYDNLSKALTAGTAGGNTAYYTKWVQEYEDAFGSPFKPSIKDGQYIGFDRSTYPPKEIRQSLADAQQEFANLVSVDTAKLRPEELAKLKDYRNSFGFVLGGQSYTAQEAANKYDIISRKPIENLTPEEKAFKDAYGPRAAAVADAVKNQRVFDIERINNEQGANVNFAASQATDLSKEYSPEQKKRLTGSEADVLGEGKMQAAKTPVESNQLIGGGTGALGATAPQATTAPTTQTAAQGVDAVQAGKVGVAQAAPGVSAATAGMDAVQGQVTKGVEAAQETQSAIAASGITGAQGESVDVTGAPLRTLSGKELVSAAFSAKQAAAFTEDVTAAQAQPTALATVQGQLTKLYSDFKDGAPPPPWAAGAMRAATAAMASRGIVASTIAGQSLVQAAMESALPIATADAQTQATFELQNLSNRQQRAMMAAEQRAAFIGAEFDQRFQAKVANAAKVSDVANMNFTASQQVALENSRAANTMNLENLSNRQAVLMGELAELSELNMANLNNRQQAQSENARNFLQMDLANLDAAATNDMFKKQQVIQSLFTDAAATNAAKALNVSNQMEMDKFFSGLQQNVNLQNAAQADALTKADADRAAAISTFNAEQQAQRDEYNSKRLVEIVASNATWRRQAATIDTANQQEANKQNSTAFLGIREEAYAQLWEEYKDAVDMVYATNESYLGRAVSLSMAQIAANAQDGSSSGGILGFAGNILGRIGGSIASSVINKIDFSSDASLKENIKRVGMFPNGVGIYTWDWRDGRNAPTTGFIAQNVYKYLPHCVKRHPINNTLMVNYGEVILKCVI